MFVTNTMNKKIIHSDISPMSLLLLLIRSAKVRFSERKTKKNDGICRPNGEKNGAESLSLMTRLKNAKWILHFRPTFRNFATNGEVTLSRHEK